MEYTPSSDSSTQVKGPTFQIFPDAWPVLDALKKPRILVQNSPMHRKRSKYHKLSIQGLPIIILSYTYINIRPWMAWRFPDVSSIEKRPSPRDVSSLHRLRSRRVLVFHGKNGRTSQAMWGSPNAINIYKPIRPIIWGKFIPPNSWRFRAWFILGFTTIWVSFRHDFSQSDFWTFLGMVKTCKDCKDLKKLWAGSCWIARINSVSQIHFYVKRHTIP